MSKNYNVSRWVVLEHPIDSLNLLADGLINAISVGVLGDSPKGLPGEQVSNWFSNLGPLGDVKPPLSEQQVSALAAQGYADTLKAGGSQAAAQKTADAITSYANTQTANTTDWDAFTNGLTSWFPSLPESSWGDVGGLVVPIILVIAAAFAVNFLVRRV